MNSTDFGDDIRNIVGEGFTPEGLHKLDHYAELFINGRIVYKRFSPFEQHGCAAGGETIASLLAEAEASADRDAAPDGIVFVKSSAEGKSRSVCTMPGREND